MSVSSQEAVINSNDGTVPWAAEAYFLRLAPIHPTASLESIKNQYFVSQEGDGQYRKFFAATDQSRLSLRPSERSTAATRRALVSTVCAVRN